MGAAHFGNQRVDLIATTQDIWDMFWEKALPNQRFEEESSDVAKIGFKSLRLMGTSITVDQYCPAGYIFGLNTEHIQFWITTLPKYQSNGLPLTATWGAKTDSDGLEPCDGNEAEGASHRERLSESAPLAGDATVRSAGNMNLQRAAEMTAPLARVVRIGAGSNNNVGWTGFKEALETGSPIADEELPFAA
jgi:hypothetical protein